MIYNNICFVSIKKYLKYTEMHKAHYKESELPKYRKGFLGFS